MSLTVIAPAFYPTPDSCAALVRSCENLNLDLLLYGLGEKHENLATSKIVRLHQELEALDSEYILFTDSADSFMLADEEEIVRKLHPNEVLISAEKGCWPDTGLARLYPKSLSPWRYVNSGGYAGRRDAVIELLARVAKQEIPRGHPFSGDDQYRFVLTFLGLYPMQLDTLCSVFQTMYAVNPGELKWQDGRLVNLANNSKPCVLHFNGHVAGINECFQQRFNPKPLLV